MNNQHEAAQANRLPPQQIKHGSCTGTRPDVLDYETGYLKRHTAVRQKPPDNLMPWLPVQTARVKQTRSLRQNRPTVYGKHGMPTI